MAAKNFTRTAGEIRPLATGRGAVGGGRRFRAGDEPQACRDAPGILPPLDAPTGSAFERGPRGRPLSP